MPHTYKNDEELQKDLAYWQEILRLQDWDVTVSINRSWEIRVADVAGYVNWVFPNKQADIQLLDPIDYEPGITVTQDHEETLVHELLHLHYAGFDRTEDGSVENGLLEQSINAVSAALVRLRREAYNESYGDMRDKPAEIQKAVTKL